MRQQAERALLRFVLTMVISLCAWPLLHPAFSAAFRGASNLVLADRVFGHGGHVRLEPRAKASNVELEDGPSWDTSLRLSVDGIEHAQHVNINPRRSAYIPLLVLLALILAAPLGWRRKLACVGVCVPALLAFAIACQAIVAVWIFSRVPGLIYEPSTLQLKLIEMAYSGVAVPMEHKYLVPALLAGMLVAWQRSREHTGAA